jgi:hypothetical protein
MNPTVLRAKLLSFLTLSDRRPPGLFPWESFPQNRGAKSDSWCSIRTACSCIASASTQHIVIIKKYTTTLQAISLAENGTKSLPGRSRTTKRIKPCLKCSRPQGGARGITGSKTHVRHPDFSMPVKMTDPNPVALPEPSGQFDWRTKQRKPLATPSVLLLAKRIVRGWWVPLPLRRAAKC